MRIAIWDKNFGAIGGSEKYGFAMLEPLLGRHEIDMLVPTTDEERERRELEELEEVLGVSLAGVSIERCRKAREAEELELGAGYDLLINMTPLWPCGRNLDRAHARRNVLLIFCPVPLRREPQVLVDALRRGMKRLQLTTLELLCRWFPGLELRRREHRRRHGRLSALLHLPLFALKNLCWLGRRGPPRQGVDPAVLDSYQRLVTISDFIDDWTRRYWERPSMMLYPPVDAHRFEAGRKEPVVLVAGRISSCKRPEVMIEQFIELYDQGTLSGWRMRLCGAVNDDENRRLAASLQRRAEGYPISLETDLTLAELQDAYAGASLLWHAKGYGHVPEDGPYPFEHFGITPAEGMAAGCVPMIFDGGGLSEVVGDPSCGYLWSTPEQLREQVRAFLNLTDDEVAAMRQAARDQAMTFGRDAFRRRTCEIYRALDIPHRPPEALGTAASGLAGDVH